MFEKNNPTNALNILYIKEKKHTLLVFQNIAQPVKNKYFFQGWYYLAVKNCLHYYMK